jgi:hypothetical protein
MMLGLGQFGDVTGQCASGLNPNYDENGVFVSCTEGSPVAPNCVAGQQATALDDGSYACSPGITAQSIGVSAPNCHGGSPYLDGNGDWQCSAPPPPPVAASSSSGGTGAFLAAAALAIAAYVYFGTKAAKTYGAFASGDSKKILGSVA